jgi:KTSC domain-containing protein
MAKFNKIQSQLRKKAFGGITGKIFGRIRSIFSGRPKAPPQQPQSRVVGHRGIAARNLKPGQQDLSAENVAKWRNLTGQEVEDFVENEQPLLVHSSNVSLMQYFKDVQKLLVEFHNGASYLYDNVTKSEALQFATYQSKGGAVWDLLRVRGSRTAHKKPYRKLSGKIIATPKQQGLTPQQIQDLQVPPGEAL